MDVDNFLSTFPERLKDVLDQKSLDSVHSDITTLACSLMDNFSMGPNEAIDKACYAYERMIANLRKESE